MFLQNDVDDLAHEMAVSQVLFLRALSDANLALTGVVILLSIDLTDPSFWFTSLGMVPLPKFGLLARGFTPFHFLRFQKNFVTVALSEYFQHIHRNLADFSAVRDESLPTFTDGTNTPGISAPGEPGLSSTHVHMSRDYSPFHVCFIHHYRITITYIRLKLH